MIGGNRTALHRRDSHDTVHPQAQEGWDMSLELLDTIVTFGIFAMFGYLVARRIPVPVRGQTWFLLILLTIVGNFTGRSTALISIYGFAVYLNHAIVSCVIGIGVTLAVRSTTRRRITAGTA
jgi:hypothetical protein